MPETQLNNASIYKPSPRLRTWLAAGYALLILYASLSPFTGWREQGLDFVTVLTAPINFSPKTLTLGDFDVPINILAYLPLGLMSGLALRARFGVLVSVLLGLSLGISLSAGMEYLQMYLPTRVSSNLDIISNGLGTFLGLLLAVSVTSWHGLSDRLTRLHTHLFNQDKEMDFGLTLLALWMFGQVNPSLPMLGNVFISEVARQPFVPMQPAPFDWWESCAVMLNLWMLGTLMLTLLRSPRNTLIVLPVVLGVLALLKFVAAAVLLKSWALLLWINSEAVLGMLVGMALLLIVTSLQRSSAILFGAGAAICYFTVVNMEFVDNKPSSAMSIYQWHLGHLLDYNGLAQTIYLVFPLLLIFHLHRIRKL